MYLDKKLHRNGNAENRLCSHDSIRHKKKASDCVKTNGLLQDKIEYYTKIDGVTNWIDSYYANRKKFTKWDTANSKTVDNHKTSIVQGSNLGASILEKLMIFLFAYDCVMLIADFKNLKKLMNKELITV